MLPLARRFQTFLGTNSACNNFYYGHNNNNIWSKSSLNEIRCNAFHLSHRRTIFYLHTTCQPKLFCLDESSKSKHSGVVHRQASPDANLCRSQPGRYCSKATHHALFDHCTQSTDPLAGEGVQRRNHFQMLTEFEPDTLQMLTCTTLLPLKSLTCVSWSGNTSHRGLNTILMDNLLTSVVMRGGNGKLRSIAR